MDTSSPSGSTRSLLSRGITITLWVAAGVLALIALILPVARGLSGTATATLDVPASTSDTILLSSDAFNDTCRGVDPCPDAPGPELRLAPDEGDITVTVIAGPDETEDSTNTSRAPIWLSVLSEAGTALWAAALAWSAFLLAGILGSTAGGEPFRHPNPRRWTLLGVAILIASIGSDTVNYLASNAFVDYYAVPDTLLVTNAYYSFLPPVIAVTAFLVAGAFAAGRRSQNELQGLV